MTNRSTRNVHRSARDKATPKRGARTPGFRNDARTKRRIDRASLRTLRMSSYGVDVSALGLDSTT